MKKLAASQAKNKFGELLDLARREPVQIEKKGRKVAVVMSVEEYDRLTSLEDEYWAFRAKQAKAEGFMGTENSEDLLNELLDVEC